ncbi:MAG: DUF899 family protein [Phycisphaerae bacterium]|nr:DUF899 family protein [Phycisphaerae bacterium]
MSTSTPPTSASPAPTNNQSISEILTHIERLKTQLSEARRNAPAEVVADLPLFARDGSEASLSHFFGTRDDLLVIHNMGMRCSYCTLWADGFIGLWPHLNDRTAVVLVSEDAPLAADAFARGRGWPFPAASMHGTSFAKELGVETTPGHTKPGASAFHRSADGVITRTGFTEFGPGDDFCAAWPLFDLLQGGVGPWEPKFAYGRSGCCGGGCCGG